MLKILTACALLLCCCAVVALPSAAYSEPPMVVRLAHTGPPENHISLAFQKFADIVAENSHGNVVVRVFPNAVLGSDRTLLEKVRRGELEIGVGSTANLAAFSPLYAVFELPYITRPQYRKNLYASIDSGGPLHTYFQNVADSLGMHALMYAEYGYRHFASVHRPLKTSADLQKMRMRTTDSPVEMAMINALGASAVPVPWAEVYTALQQGIVDGEGNTLPHLWGARHHEVLRYVLLSAHSYGMQIAMTNKAWWDGLHPEVRALLEQAAAEAVAYQRAVLYPKNEEDAAAAMLRGGVRIFEPSQADREKLRSLLRPVWDALPLPRELLELVLATQRD